MKVINLKLKKFIAFMTSVLVLSSSVFSSYIGASQVYASDIAVHAYGALWEIFLGIGSTVLLSTGVIENVEEITDIDVAKFGADFMENKMGLSADTANAVCSFFIPDAPNSISEKYADAFLAYENGTMTLEDFKSFDPYADDIFHIYMSGLWDDLCSSVSSFVDDVISGNNELSYAGQLISAADLFYDGNYEMVGDKYSIKISTIRSGSSGWKDIFVQTAPLLTVRKQFIYWPESNYPNLWTAINYPPYWTSISDKPSFKQYSYNDFGELSATFNNVTPFGFEMSSVSANIPILGQRKHI